ncbi:unnamed protein product [Nezara viridula]|uniref:Uncharacterized protein n=1 Tax=Nezara viridula TaxID=85310 RepID=A0A9P0H6R8_NEZVI|nr:unnamed protein product [Nezara viridula]
MAARILYGKPLALPDTPIMQEMINSCRRHGDRVYLEDVRTKKHSTFRQVLDNAGAISSTLRKLGQGPGKVVLILNDTCVESITTTFGIWLSGAASTAVNPNLPTEEIVYFLKTCRSEVIFCKEDYLDKIKDAVSSLDWAVTIICPNRQDGVLDYYKCLEEGNSAEGIVLEGWWTGKDHALAVMFTSGTTGNPKGVIVRDEAFMYNFLMKDYWTESSILMLTTPMYWISNTLVTAISSCIGCKILIASRMSVKEVMITITEYKPTEWFTGPAILIDMCQEENLDNYDFSSLQVLSISGSILLPDHRKMITKKILGNRHCIRSMYGCSEAGIISFDQTIPDIDSPKLASIGKVAKGAELKVVDPETGKILPPFAIGELCIKSPSVLKQYINKEITNEDMDKDGFWHLGDLGYYDDEEYLFYSSRLKDVMKYRGQQIAPAELENVLQRHPDVIESCVVGKTCLELGGDLPAAFVVKRSGSNLTEEELYNYISENVIDEKKLRGGIFFVDSLPKSSVGKILRYELRKQLV